MILEKVLPKINNGTPTIAANEFMQRYCGDRALALIWQRENKRPFMVVELRPVEGKSMEQALDQYLQSGDRAAFDAWAVLHNIGTIRYFTRGGFAPNTRALFVLPD